MRIHLDTDLGGDTDDACALAMLLGWPGVELTGITTVADPGGRRAGYVAHCLQLAGRPAWGPDMDFNVQFDTLAAQIVTARAAALTLVTLPVTLKAHLRAADLPRLGAAGPLGELLARQAQAHGQDHNMAELGRGHPGLPDDLLNFHYDPVACAVAAGWSGAVVAEQRLRPVQDGAVLRFPPDPDARPTKVVVDLDAAAFTETWLGAVEAAQPDTASSP